MAAVDDLYAQLRPIAATEFSNYILARTPPALQAAMLDLVGANALVADGASIVVNLDGAPDANSPGLADVAAGVVDSVDMTT